MGSVPVELRDENGAGITGKIYDGVPFGPETPDDVEKHLEAYNAIVYGDSDVYVISYPKSGTHWTFEIVKMLKNGRTEYHKDMLPLLGMHKKDTLEAMPCPRVINSHLYARHMPKDIFQKSLKMIHVYRNPKDVAVSYFNFMQKLRHGNYKDCTFKSFLPMFIEGKVMCGDWYEYMKDWKTFTDDHPDYPLLMISYEDMKKDLRGCVKKIATFLETNTSEDLVDEIAEKCQFQNMLAEKTTNIPAKMNMVTGTGTNIFYRKGDVGDWKNWFTVAESEMFDAVFGPKIESLNLDVKYTI